MVNLEKAAHQLIKKLGYGEPMIKRILGTVNEFGRTEFKRAELVYAPQVAVSAKKVKAVLEAFKVVEELRAVEGWSFKTHEGRWRYTSKPTGIEGLSPSMMDVLFMREKEGTITFILSPYTPPPKKKADDSKAVATKATAAVLAKAPEVPL